MGAFLTSRQSDAVEEADVGSNHAYKYPPKSGNYFGSHFIMGGERFDTPQPEAYLFGENADLNLLGSRPTAFPYPPPQANEPTKTLKSLVNIRKESVRFVKTSDCLNKTTILSTTTTTTTTTTSTITTTTTTTTTSAALTTTSPAASDTITTAKKSLKDNCNGTKGSSFNIEFTFDSDAKCAITIYYFCTEEITPSGLSYSPRDSSLTSETYHYKRGVNQIFIQTSHIFNPSMYSEDDLSYSSERDIFPVAIHCVIEEGVEGIGNEKITKQSHTTICVIDHHADGTYVLRALKQKIFVDGLCYLLQEIYGIENKNINKSSIDEDTDDNGSECVICMCDTRDTLILPCRHLCLCNSCADSLRYQANNCPICRSPFRALLQIRSVQKSITGTTIANVLTPQNSQDGNDNIPPGYVSVPLIEALNGPPQITIRNQTSVDTTDANEADAVQAADQLNRSVDKQNNSKHNDRHSKDKSNSNPPEIRMSVLLPKDDSQSVKHIAPTIMSTNLNNNINNNNNMNNKNIHDKSPRQKFARPSLQQNHRDNIKIINEKNLQSPNDADDDSDAEKLSPLLEPMKKMSKDQHHQHHHHHHLHNNQHNQLQQQQQQPLTNNLITNSALHMDGVDESIDDTDTDLDDQESDKKSRSGIVSDGEIILAGAEDSDYYTPEDPHTTILSPLCADKNKSNNEITKSKDNLTVSPSPLAAIKENMNSLPDSPISGNSASTRSSGDSYSSSSSTRQLLSSVPSTDGVKICDEKQQHDNGVAV